MKTIIAGCRKFEDYAFVKSALDSHIDWEITRVISGNADGVDLLGEAWAIARGVDLRIFPAKWTKYGNPAGMIRNGEMAEVAEALIAFPSKDSIGTIGMINLAIVRGLKIKIINI